jgi:hypothetical protein
VTIAKVEGVSVVVEVERLKAVRLTGVLSTGPELFPFCSPGAREKFSWSRNRRHPWTKRPVTGPASNASPARYSSSRSSRSEARRNSSCPTWYVVRPGPE